MIKDDWLGRIFLAGRGSTTISQIWIPTMANKQRGLISHILLVLWAMKGIRGSGARDYLMEQYPLCLKARDSCEKKRTESRAGRISQQKKLVPKAMQRDSSLSFGFLRGSNVSPLSSPPPPFFALQQLFEPLCICLSGLTQD